MERMPQNGCDVIQAEVDTDVEIAKAAINLSTFRPTTLIEKAQILLFSTTQRFPTVMHSFRSDKVKSYVYNIPGSQQVLGEKIQYIETIDRYKLFHEVPAEDRYLVKKFVTMYCFRMPYWMRLGVHGIRDWKINLGFQRIIKKETALKDCSKAFSLPKQCQDVEPTVVRQWQHCIMQIRRAPWHLSDTICSARKLPELKCSSGLNNSHQPYTNLPRQ